MKIRKLLDDVLREIEPGERYKKEIFSRVNQIIDKINKGQKNIRAILGGSGSKGTWLKTFDADIFVLFDYKKYGNDANLSDILEKILKKKFKRIIRLHGSRDYFQIRQGKFTLEIVPILRIKKADNAKNITDVSPLHSRWVLKHRKLADEMKLTKQFCQAQNVYGAESYIRGFSGYICEILTVNYGSFPGLVRNAAKWQDKVVIDVEKYYRGRDVFRLVNASKLVSPLIVIDPVQKDRNAAAAVSKEKFDAFIKAARGFIKNPSKRFFEKKSTMESFMEKKDNSKKLLLVELIPLSGKTDVIGTRLLKIYEFLKERLEYYGFNASSGWEWDRHGNAQIFFLHDKKPLPKTVEIEGPPLPMKEHVKSFRQKHQKAFARKGKIFAIEQRKFTAPETFLSEILKSKYVSERSKSSKITVL